MNVVSTERGPKWKSQMNRSQKNVVLNDHGLKWSWSQMNRSKMKIVSNVVVSNDLVSIVMEPSESACFSDKFTVKFVGTPTTKPNLLIAGRWPTLLNSIDMPFKSPENNWKN